MHACLCHTTVIWKHPRTHARPQCLLAEEQLCFRQLPTEQLGNPVIADVWLGRSSHQKPPCLPVSLDNGPEALHWLWPHVLLLILLHPAPQFILCPRAFAPTTPASWTGALHDTRPVPWILQIYTECHLLRNPSPATPVLNWNPRQSNPLSSSLL